jgi:predicted nucleic acid-binding protein
MRLYLETTMFNYYFDAEREGHEDTVRLFEAIGRGEHEGYTSPYVLYELEDAPEPKRSEMLKLVRRYGIHMLETSKEAERLAAIYIEQGIVPSRFQDDSTHVACASIYGMDCILSYNFQHINRTKTKVQTGRINLEEGYGSVVICTAKEVLEDEQPD